MKLFLVQAVPIHGELLDYSSLILAPVPHLIKEPLPPRHRRKRREEEVVSNSPQNTGSQPRETNSSRGPEFDLEISAFPPLPRKFNSTYLHVSYIYLLISNC